MSLGSILLRSPAALSSLLLTTQCSKHCEGTIVEFFYLSYGTSKPKEDQLWVFAFFKLSVLSGMQRVGQSRLDLQ